MVVLSVLGFVGAGREKSGLLMLYFFLNFFLVTCLLVASYAAFCFQVCILYIHVFYMYVLCLISHIALFRIR